MSDIIGWGLVILFCIIAIIKIGVSIFRAKKEIAKMRREEARIVSNIKLDLAKAKKNLSNITKDLDRGRSSRSRRGRGTRKGR